MWYGSPIDVAAQSNIDEHREWIDAQPNMIAVGRSVCVFEAQSRSIDELATLIDRFYRVILLIPPDRVDGYLRDLEAKGYHPATSLVLSGGRDCLERCGSIANGPFERPPESQLLFPDESTSSEIIRAIQEFYRAVNLIPQPESFIRGYGDTVTTAVTIAADGRVLGTSSIQHLGKAGPQTVRMARSCNTGVLREYRKFGLARWLNAIAVVEAGRRRPVAEVWGNTAPDNTAAVAFHESLGRYPDRQVGYIWIERAVPS